MKSNLTRNFTTMKKNIRKELSAIGYDMEADVVRYIEKNKISVQGNLVKSVNNEVVDKEHEAVLFVGSNIKYGVFVHEGTRPHWAPLKPLIKWVEKKGIAGQFSTKTRKLSKSKSSMEQIIQVAKLVQYKIAAKGTTGQPFLRDVLFLYENIIADRLAAKMSKAM